MAVEDATVEAMIDDKDIKQEPVEEEKDSPNVDQVLPVATEGEEQSEIPAPDSPKDKVSEEDDVSVKEVAKDTIEEKEETTTEMVVDTVEATASPTEEEASKVGEGDSIAKIGDEDTSSKAVDVEGSAKVGDEDTSSKAVDMDSSAMVVDVDSSAKVVETDNSAKVPVPENAKLHSEGGPKDPAEEEFRPPTPDPRFEVLPPVFKGTELSALCTIM